MNAGQRGLTWARLGDALGVVLGLPRNDGQIR